MSAAPGSSGAKVLEGWIEEAARRESRPVYLVSGDLVLAEPAAQRLASALGAALGVAPDMQRRPARLAPVLEDLLTFSLFAPAKVVVATETALLAERAAAADLLDEAGEAGSRVDAAGGLAGRERQAAARLLQALRLFGLDPRQGAPGDLLRQLPPWAFQGGADFRRRHPRGRSKADVEAFVAGLETLLAAAQATDLQGYAEGDLTVLGQIIDGGLPRGHSLILVESSVGSDHPLVRRLAEAGAWVELGTVEADKGSGTGGWAGVDRLAEALETETGRAMSRDGIEELARRTLRGSAGGRGGDGEAEAHSTARFAAEYRKLAELVGPGARIERDAVIEAVADRGEEDVWKLLDAVAEGRAGDALSGLARRLAAADDALAERLSFFSLLASFARQMTAMAGLMREAGVPAGEANYARFKDRWAPRLQAAAPAGEPKNPLAAMHPFRLHRIYLAASRLDAATAVRLPWKALEAELRLKGESASPEDALAAFVVDLAGAYPRPTVARGKPNSSFSRR